MLGTITAPRLSGVTGGLRSVVVIDGPPTTAGGWSGTWPGMPLATVPGHQEEQPP
jgi:hypothetical protein